jgi:hypothetical protein
MRARFGVARFALEVRLDADEARTRRTDVGDASRGAKLPAVVEFDL